MTEPKLPAGETASEELCPKTGSPHSYGIHDPGGEWQCWACGKLRPFVSTEGLPSTFGQMTGNLKVPPIVEALGPLTERDLLGFAAEVAAPIAPAADELIQEASALIREYERKRCKLQNQWPVMKRVYDFLTRAEEYRLRAKPSAEGDGWIAWDRPPARARRDIVGQRNLLDGRTEYLMHNEALCSPYYVAVSPLPAPPSGQGEVR